MTFTIDPNLIENNEVRLTENTSGELAIEHVPSGRTITVDEDVSISDIVTDPLSSNVDGQGNDITNVGSLGSQSVNTGNTQTDNISPNNEDVVGISDVYPLRDYLHSGDGMPASFSDKKIRGIGESTSGGETYEICTLSGTHDFVEVTFAGHDTNTSSSTRDAYIKWAVFPASDGSTVNYRLEKIHDYGGGSDAPSVSVDQDTGTVEVSKTQQINTGWLKIETYGTEVTA